MPTLMIFFLRLGSGKNLIFDENSKKKTTDHKLLYGIAPGYLQFMVIDRSEIFNSIL